MESLSDETIKIFVPFLFKSKNVKQMGDWVFAQIITNNVPSGYGNTSSVRASPLNNPMANDCKFYIYKKTNRIKQCSMSNSSREHSHQV